MTTIPLPAGVTHLRLGTTEMRLVVGSGGATCAVEQLKDVRDGQDQVRITVTGSQVALSGT